MSCLLPFDVCDKTNNMKETEILVSIDFLVDTRFCINYDGVENAMPLLTIKDIGPYFDCLNHQVLCLNFRRLWRSKCCLATQNSQMAFATPVASEVKAQDLV